LRSPEKRAHLSALEEAEARLRAGEAASLTHVIEVIQMEQKKAWVTKYFTPEQRRTLEGLTEQSYSENAKRKMAAWPTWTEEDQRRVDAQYAHLAAELKRLVAVGADPAGAEAQAVAKLQVELLEAFTQRDPDIEMGLKTW